jgi:hypothetical protein
MQLCLENIAYPGIRFLYATKQFVVLILSIRRLSKSGTLCVYCFSPLVEHIIVHWLNKAWFANDWFVFQFFSLQDPAEADKLLKIQRDLDETKIILVSNFMLVEPSGTWLTSFSNSKMELFSCAPCTSPYMLGKAKVTSGGVFFYPAWVRSKGAGCYYTAELVL